MKKISLLVLCVFCVSMTVFAQSGNVGDLLGRMESLSNNALRLARSGITTVSRLEQIQNYLTQIQDLQLRIQNFYQRGHEFTSAQVQRLQNINANVNEIVQRVSMVDPANLAD